MSFLYPSFLFALSAIAIPIIIHLFNFRKFKTVYFSNIRFLKEVKQETQAKSTLKHLLVLVARILAITFLVFAFAQPFIPKNNTKDQVGDKFISIFIDNSFSMEAINKNGTLLDEAKKRALEIISSFKPTDRFQLLTNDFEGRHQRLINKEEFTSLLDDVKISPATRNISEITSRQIDLLNTSGDIKDEKTKKNKLAFIISDFQKGNFNIGQLKNDSSIQFNLIRLEAAEISNVYIDTCWFETPVRQFNEVEKLHIRIKNLSDKDLENNSLKLFINDVQKTAGSFNVNKDSDTEIVFSFSIKETSEHLKTSGLMHCRLELNDYPITFDDRFYFSFEVSKTIPVLCINSSDADVKTPENPYLNKLFAGDSLFIFKNVNENSLDYSTLNTNRLIILNELKNISSGLAQELKRFIDNGGSLLIFPSEKFKPNSFTDYKDFLVSAKTNYYEGLDTLDTKVDQINMDDVIYKDVFDKKNAGLQNLYLPRVYNHYTFFKATRSNEEYLLKLQNGDVFLSKFNVGKGKIYLSSVPLKTAFSNFPKHSIFVPTLYKIGINSQNPQPLFYTIGNSESIENNTVLKGGNVYHIKSLNNNFDIIPEHHVMDSKTEINVHDQISNAGNYNLYSDKDLLTGFAFNFNRKESDLSYLTADELKVQVEIYNNNNINILNINSKNINNLLSETEQGQKLWKFCIVLTLIFIAMEVLLIRFMKG